MTKFDFQIGETVFLKTDPEQLPRMVTGIMIRPGSVTYALCSGMNESLHYEFEIAVSKDILFSQN